MSIKKIHPINEREDQEELQKGLHSVQTFNDIRRKRIQVREATLILTPKTTQYQHLCQPKISQLTSQDQIVEEEEIIVIEECKVKFTRAIQKLLLLLKFFRLIKEISKSKRKKNMSIAIQKQNIPFLPHLLGIKIWREFINIITLFANILYPIYITYSDYNSYDFVTILVFILDSFFFIDLIIEQMTCQIDSANNLLKRFPQILLHNLTGWLIIDILTILPYRIIIAKENDVFSLRDYCNLVKLLKIVKYFIGVDRKILYHYSDSGNKEITVQDSISIRDYLSLIDARIISVLTIFKNMFILISAFGCLWQLVSYYEEQESRTNNLSSYIDGLFWAIQTVTVVGYGNVQISTSMQYNLIIFWLLIGVGFYSFTIGNLACILDQSNSESMQYDIEDMEVLMNSITAPEWLQNKIWNFLYYNMENNSFWNYNKLFESLPGQLKKYTICFSQQHLIVNINLFKLDINIAAKLLPLMKIYHYKQYETIYHLGSPSLDVYFLVTGEVRLCNAEGNSLLNIFQGSIFGEMEILDQVSRKQSAIASKNSLVIMFSIQNFLDIIQTDEGLSFEIEQLGLRRKILVKDSHLKIKQNSKIRRVSCISSLTTSLAGSNNKQKEKQFKERISKESFKYIQMRLLKYIFGRNQERKWRLLNKFREAVHKIIKFIKEQKNLNRQRRGSRIGITMITNFTGTTENEQQMIKVLNKLQKQKRQLVRTLKQIMSHVKSGLQAPILLTPSPYFHQILEEQKQQLKTKKILESSQQVKKQMLKKIDLMHQYKQLGKFWANLEEELEQLKKVRIQLRYEQMEIDGTYFDIQGVIKQII